MILVVEDEVLLRVLAAEALADAGFKVLEAERGDEAFDGLTARAAHINAVFTDVHMPGRLDGLALAHETARCWPWVRLLLMSGNALLTAADLPAECRFLLKSYETAHTVDHLRKLYRIWWEAARPLLSIIRRQQT